MAFSMGCFACCVPCDPCDAACDETPDEAFAVVYQVEDNRANLTWTGDAMGPIDGPWPGFESGTAFSQTITSNGIVLPGSRFPCYFRLKLWRNVGGGEGSETLASQRVTISCTEGKLDLGFVALNAGESVEFNPNPASASQNATYVFPSTAIQLDENGGDRHAFPPAFGWIGGRALCAGTIVSVQAHIEWTNGLIQHNLYGEFVECFDELPPGDPGDCLDCDGTPTPAPDTVYLTISNFDGGGAVDANDDPIVLDGTYAIPLSNGYPVSCHDYTLFGTPVIAWRSTGWPFGFWLDLNVAGKANGSSGALTVPVDIKPEWAGDGVSLWVAELCGAGPVTGTVASAEWYLTQNLALALRGDPTGLFCSFDWELSW